MTVKPELKIIADHLRSSCFLVADGVLPSNEGRGYVLRRIMRRGMRQLHKLGAREATMYKLVDALIKEMGAAFPELARAKDTIVETLKNEEEKFRETLEKGLKILDEEMVKSKTKKFSGAVAFKLYDTYGFPLDLTQDILKEKNIEVDVEEFSREMELQRERAKANWKGSGEVAEDKLFFDLKEKFGETKFLGYEKTHAKAKVLAVTDNFIILDKTPFYATSGGQKGDDGKIGDTEIFETKKFAGNLFAHFFADKKTTLKVGDEVEAVVNPKTRQMRAQNHSATHLLHKALKLVLGNSISQKGSNVDAESFTFDFNFNRGMTPEEIKKVEDLANSYIKENNSVDTNLMDLEKARESGAEALFGEKYDAEVRVVKMGPSVELCGGTHVKNTSEIEMLKIISEKSIASGIRRIEAKSGFEAKKYLADQEAKAQNNIRELQEKIVKRNLEITKLGGAKQEDSAESDAKILEEILKKKDKEIERLKKQILLEGLKELKAEKIGDKNFVFHIFKALDGKEFREIATEIKNKKEFQDDTIIALFNEVEGPALGAISVSANIVANYNANNLIKEIGGKGGGKPDFATAGGINDISQAIEILKKL